MLHNETKVLSATELFLSLMMDLPKHKDVQHNCSGVKVRTIFFSLLCTQWNVSVLKIWPARVKARVKCGHLLHDTLLKATRRLLRDLRPNTTVVKFLQGSWVGMRGTSVCLPSGELLHVEQRKKKNILRYSRGVLSLRDFLKIVVLILGILDIFRCFKIKNRIGETLWQSYMSLASILSYVECGEEVLGEFKRNLVYLDMSMKW